MAVLTAFELAYIRDETGDDQQTYFGNYMVPTDVVQAIYDHDDYGAGDLDRTVVFVLRRMVAKTARLMQTGGAEYKTEAQQQYHEHLRDLLATWEKRTGLYVTAYGTLTIDTLFLTDAAAESEWTPE